MKKKDNSTKLDLTWEELEEQKLANKRKEDDAQGKTARKKYV